MTAPYKLLARLVPKRLRAWAYLRKHAQAEPHNAPPAKVFSKIYEEARWGGAVGQFYSGSGSHTSAITEPYVDAVRAFAQGFPGGLDAVDLGCGDFEVGSQLRDAFRNYMALDVVPSLIERNRKKFLDLDVEFGCLDIVDDPLPPGDVVLIRQVLQHLSNEQIASVVKKLPIYKYLILTEHLPADPRFPANRDKRPGPDIRTIGPLAEALGPSGVILTESPFSLPVKADVMICEVADLSNTGTVIRTNLYELR